MERKLEALLKGQGFRATRLRSRIMSSVRGRDNASTERRLRLALVREGIRGWALHPKQLPGTPDFFFASKLVAVFVDGCFWHGCNRCGHVPGKNRPFWAAKLARNRERDRAAGQRLGASGIRVLRFWEHELKDDLPSCVQRLQRLLDRDDARPRSGNERIPSGRSPRTLASTGRCCLDSRDRFTLLGQD